MEKIVWSGIPRGLTALLEWASCMILLLMVPSKRSRTVYIGLSAVMLAIQEIYMCKTKNILGPAWLLCMCGALAIMYLYIRICGDISPIICACVCFNAFMVSELGSCLVWVSGIFCAYFRIVRLRQIIVMSISCAVFLIFMYLIQYHIMKSEYFYRFESSHLITIAAIVLVTFAFSNISYVMTSVPGLNYSSWGVFRLQLMVDFLGEAVLYGYQSRAIGSMQGRETQIMRSALEEQYNQYLLYREGTEEVRRMRHDLQHQIDGLRSEDNEERRNMWINELQEELDKTRTITPTGNSVLDALLGAKMSRVREKKIQLTCVADGRLLSFMRPEDICTIFGNALDNAIEAVCRISEEERHLVHLSVSRQRQFTLIEVSNYCEDMLNLGSASAEMLPRTTKENKSLHGFGLKSIRQAVEKYNGTMTIQVQGGWFYFRALLPD